MKAKTKYHSILQSNPANWDFLTRNCHLGKPHNDFGVKICLHLKKIKFKRQWPLNCDKVTFHKITKFDKSW